MTLKIRDERQLRALTGLSQVQFDKLLVTFTQVYEAERQRAYMRTKLAGTRKRKPGGGQKGKLPRMEDKLLFVLYYYKTYPTFDVLGTHFDLSRSKAHENLHKLSPILHATLVEMGMMPKREFKTPDELKAALGGIDQILIDATERKIRRSKDDATQREHYSGKKKRHTVKNTVISTIDKVILFVGRTFTGRNNDYKMLKEELPPDLDWFSEINVLVDLGYLGIQSDYAGDGIDIPHKKPRKSKKNPDPKLADEQKAANRILSQARIFVENAIGGIKRYNILVHAFRNHKENFQDDVIAVSAALWNLSLSY